MDTKRLCVPEAEEILGRYFPVLDCGFVSLVDYMGGDEAIERNARCSYGQGTRKKSDTRKLIRYLMRSRHTSPFESTVFQFHIGLPIFVMRQLIRHRMASVSEYSGRYSVMPMLFYTPGQEDVCYQSRSNKQGRADSVVDPEFYQDMLTVMGDVRSLAHSHYKNMLNADVARELARIDLPLSMYTYCYWKMDLHNLLHLISLRSDPHAQKETRQYSDVMAAMARRVAPMSVQAFIDYRMGSRSFNEGEMAAIRAFASSHVSPITWENPPESARTYVNEVLHENGIEFEYDKKGNRKESREQTEFWAKLRRKPVPNFELDLSQSHDADYYSLLVQEHAVEVPA